MCHIAFSLVLAICKGRATPEKSQYDMYHYRLPTLINGARNKTREAWSIFGDVISTLFVPR